MRKSGEFDYVCSNYGVPAKKWMFVRLNRRLGVIVNGAGQYIEVRFAGMRHASVVHPREKGLEYLNEDGSVLFPPAKTEIEGNVQ